MKRKNARYIVRNPEITDATKKMVCLLEKNFYPPQEVVLLQSGDKALRKIVLRLQETLIDDEF